MAQDEAFIGPDRTEVGNAYVPAYCPECRAPAKREPLSGAFSIRHKENCSQRPSQLAHPQTKYTELDKGRWVTFKVLYAKYSSRRTTSVRSFRTQDDAEEFADQLQPGSRPRISKVETTVLRWESHG